MIRDVDWIALTVKQEAEGEPYIGKLAVAYTIVNRMARFHRSAARIVLAPYQFSCWNTNSPTRLRLDVDMTDPVWRDSYQAAQSALDKTQPDPTHGATHYLNPHVLPVLPDWYAKEKVLATIGHHEFLVA